MVSSHYQRIDKGEAIRLYNEGLADAWKDESIPASQYELAVKNELEKYRRGAACAPFSALIKTMLEGLPYDFDKSNKKAIEVGASSGYYGEVLKIAGYKLQYEACDYSPHFKELAKKLYPEMPFHLADARALPFADASYDLVISGCVMIHVPENWTKIIKETARVTKQYAIFHRTPVTLSGETKYYKKQAYGVDCIEVHYSETELMSEFLNNGLLLTTVTEIFRLPQDDLAHKVYLLEKKK